ncbi:MAG TPA: lysylphosphatidylglycerol synthase transmembrane domain-containing protein [Thermomicrobiaceae bacterium]|nr:lysylphosphatidylglycerol synthase transmembrane domain-containing protein [Thermomicrobiaceae bacterium]
MNEQPASPGSPSSPSGRSLIETIKRRFIYGIILGVLVVIGVAFLGDSPKLLNTLGTFKWALLPAILALTAGNYLLRFLKWQLYLRWLDIDHGLPILSSLGIFLSGLSMGITPGKVGEFLKAYLLRRANDTPVSVSAPIIVADRVTDGLAMMALAAVGLVAVSYGWQALVALAVLAVIVLSLIRRRSLMFRLFARFERVPRLGRRMQAIHTLYESIYLLLCPKNLLAATGIGFVSWGCECIAFFLVLLGLGFTATPHLFVTAVFILAAATLIGTLSMLPGGLGAAEASVAGLLLLLVKSPLMNHDLAAAATLLIRFCTLWFGVLLGLLALFLIERRLSASEKRRLALDRAELVS